MTTFGLVLIVAAKAIAAFAAAVIVQAVIDERKRRRYRARLRELIGENEADVICDLLDRARLK